LGSGQALGAAPSPKHRGHAWTPGSSASASGILLKPQDWQATPEGTEKFATYYRDATGLDYAWNRYYTAAWGRFMQADPYLAPEALKSPQGWNRYAYVVNDPVNYYDPSGLLWESPEGGPPQLQCEVWGVRMAGDICRVILQSLGQRHDEAYAERSENILSPQCNLSVMENLNVINFYNVFAEPAIILGEETRLPWDFILAWSAAEVGWSYNFTAMWNNNWFNLTAPDAEHTGGWIGAIPCAETGFTKYVENMACFQAIDLRQAFYLSGRAALLSQNGRYLKPALETLRAGGSYAQAAQAIADAGFDPGRKDYGQHFAGTLEALRSRLHCSGITPPFMNWGNP
jgi:RHS repeat-associated protein